MKPGRFISILIFLLSIAATLLLVVTFFSGLDHSGIRVFFNSDTLYLPALYRDLFTDRNGLQGWHFNPSPNFFPDMLVYFILQSLSGNFIVTSFLFSLLQVMALLSLIFMISGRVFPVMRVNYISISYLFVTLFLWVGIFTEDVPFSFYLVSNAFHTGAFLTGLLALLLVMRYITVTDLKTMIVLYLVCILGVVSDRLFIVMFSVPVAVTLLILYDFRKRKSIAGILLMIVLTVTAGLILFHFLSNSNYIYIDTPHSMMNFINIKSSWMVLKGQMVSYLAGGGVKGLILIISLLSFGGMLMICILEIRRGKRSGMMSFYSLFSVIYIPFVFISPVINGSYTGFDTLRYNIPALYLAMINVGIIVNYFLETLPAYRSVSFILRSVVILMILVFSYAGLSKYSAAGMKRYFSYYPEIAKRVDSAVSKEDLVYGVGEYWVAKLVTMFSKTGVRVYAVYDDIAPYEHVANHNLYYDDRAVFSFIVLNRFNDTLSYLKMVGPACEKLDSGTVSIVRVRPFLFSKLDSRPITIDSLDCNSRVPVFQGK